MHKKAFSLIELSIVLLIIGVIIAGITQSSRMITAFKISAARTATQGSAVHSIKDLVLWLEPTSDNSLINAAGSYSINNGEKILTWNDSNSQLSQKINVSQTTSGNQPTYVSSGINNLPTLQFSGGQYLDTLNTSPVPPAPLAAGQKEYTIFLVWQPSSLASVHLIAHQRGAANCTGGDRAGIYAANPSSVNTWGCGMGADTTTNSSISTNRPYLSIYRVDNTASTSSNNVKSYLNGTQSATVSASLQSLGATAFVIGFGDTGNTYYFSGYISEIIVFSRALKTSEIVDIRAYIAKKYNFGA